MHSSSESSDQPPPSYGQPSLASLKTQYANGISASAMMSTNQWFSGLCDCCSEVSTCCFVCWCPCIAFGEIAEILDEGTTSCELHGIIYMIMCSVVGFQWIYSWLYRSKMRRQYMLPEEPCNDCLVSFCCEQCAICQEYRELKHHGFDMSIGWHRNMEKQNVRSMIPPVILEEMER